ncbi:hypothetical protein [Pedobacter sp. MC2016-24]|uniref:hypothetical protein n=1 Tax=Pedobacter sp. MC2016-24 TaxID=2780090 RepID=UPI00187F5F61|nr:hypothetical protein [Pedobacter sp. MC2016-24]MBE9599481.1 hypothetical protein [Pedobacter sp. MC2016-24]
MRIIRFIFIGLITLVGLKASGQTNTPFCLKNWYVGEGVIFPFDYKLPIDIKEAKKHFTPSLADVKKAESFLLSNASDVKYINMFGMYEPRKLKKKLRQYNRQYIGYQNAELDSVILINLLNFSKRKHAKNNFDDWTKEYSRARCLLRKKLFESVS